MNRWFRFYSDALDDPKVQRLPGPLFKSWMNILCLACKYDGTLPPVDDVSFALRLSERQAMEIITDLLACGLLDETSDGYKPHNWAGRQFKSDVSTDRVKRFRKRSRSGDETADETHQNRTDSETDTERKKEATDETSKKVRGNMWKGGVRIAVGR